MDPSATHQRFCPLHRTYDEGAKTLRAGFTGVNPDGYISWGIAAFDSPGLMYGGASFMIKGDKGSPHGV